MELSRHSCVLPSNAPAVSESPFLDSKISRVLQERSGNRRHDYSGVDLLPWKPTPSSPTENFYTNPCYASHGNFASQLNGEKSEQQICHEAIKLWEKVQKVEGYKKYRDKQDPNDPKGQEHKWPETMEFAFFKACVKWPPMGRRKHMLHGRLRGRNELIAASIYQDTGIKRSRKQVSSHIQVLKNYFKEHPEIRERYLGTADDGDGKGGRNTSSAGHYLRSRHINNTHAGSGKYESYDIPANTAQSMWQGSGSLPASSMPNHPNLGSTVTYKAPFVPVAFRMFVKANQRQLHDFTKLADSGSRLADINVTDMRQWRKQHPEFTFIDATKWQNREIIVCDASLQLMADLPSGAELSVSFDMMSEQDLGPFDHFESLTSLFDGGKCAPQPTENGQPVSQMCKGFSYDQEHRQMLDIPFSSKFWVQRMASLSKHLREIRTSDKQKRKLRLDFIRRNLQSLTAIQELYATPRVTNEAQRLLTILWRFDHAKSGDSGRMTWRRVTFSSSTQPLQWNNEEEFQSVAEINLRPQAQNQMDSNYSALPLQFPQTTFQEHPQPFNLDPLQTLGLDGHKDFSNPHSASAPSVSTDLSATHSLVSLTHSQETALSHPQELENANSMDFTGGHINICLEPAISLAGYDSFGSTHGNSFHAFTGLEESQVDTNAFGDMGLGVSVGPYPSRPWPYPDLESLEAAMCSNGELRDLGGQGHIQEDQPTETGLWKLQSPFAHDSAVGVDESEARAHELSHGQHHGEIMALGGTHHREGPERTFVGY